LQTNISGEHTASIFKDSVKMDTVFSFEMLVYKQKTTLCNNPEHQNLNSHRHENQIVLAALSISININRLLKFSTKIGCKKKGKKKDGE
jgi:hypothetical protein